MSNKIEIAPNTNITLADVVRNPALMSNVEKVVVQKPGFWELGNLIDRVEVV